MSKPDFKPFQTQFVAPGDGISPEKAMRRILGMGEKIIMSISLCPPGAIKVGSRIMMYDGVTVASVIREVPLEEWVRKVFPDQIEMLADTGPFVEVVPD